MVIDENVNDSGACRTGFMPTGANTPNIHK
jgi:hypothetical protein